MASCNGHLTPPPMQPLCSGPKSDPALNKGSGKPDAMWLEVLPGSSMFRELTYSCVESHRDPTVTPIVQGLAKPFPCQKGLEKVRGSLRA